MRACVHAKAAPDRPGNAAQELEAGDARGRRRLGDELVGRGGACDDAEVIHDVDRVEGSSAKTDHDAFDAAVAHDEVRAESDRRDRDRERQRAEETGEIILVRRREQDLGRAADAKPCRLGDRGVGDEAPA